MNIEEKEKGKDGTTVEFGIIAPPEGFKVKKGVCFVVAENEQGERQYHVGQLGGLSAEEELGFFVHAVTLMEAAFAAQVARAAEFQTTAKYRGTW